MYLGVFDADMVTSVFENDNNAFVEEYTLAVRLDKELGFFPLISASNWMPISTNQKSNGEGATSHAWNSLDSGVRRFDPTLSFFFAVQ